MAKPFLPDPQMMQYIMQIATKFGTNNANRGPGLMQSILAAMRIMDEQDAIQKGEYFGLPTHITKDFVERVLYYRGSGMLFYWRPMERFYFLPYVGEGLDVEGHYERVTPLPFTGSTEGSGKKNEVKKWLDGQWWIPVYDVVDPATLTPEMWDTHCVILYDYSQQLSRTILPRQVLQEPLLQIESELIPFLRTSLLNSAGIDTMRVNSQDEAIEVANANANLVSAAINGDRLIPVKASLQTEILGHAGNGRIEDYLLAWQALDNFRLSLHGLDNGGVFEKKAHMLEGEQSGSSAGLIEADATFQRQKWCNIANSLWGLGMWYEPSEVAANIDRDGDGEMGTDEDSTEGQEVYNESEGGTENV